MSALCVVLQHPQGTMSSPTLLCCPKARQQNPREAERTQFRSSCFYTAKSALVSALGVAIMNNSLYFTLSHYFLLQYQKKFYSLVKNIIC